MNIYSIIAITIVVLIILMYNSLVKKKNNVEQLDSQIIIFIDKKDQLLPNLAGVLDKYAEHEREIHTKVAELRSRASNKNISADEKVQINNEYDSMIHSILVEADNYPELKADQGFLDMQKSINNIEEELAAVKRSYNASVTEYNNKVELFPTNLIANLFGFKRRT